jgi:hypothetical protein
MGEDERRSRRAAITAHAMTVLPVPDGVSPLSVAKNCPEASGTCVETFELNTYSIWGHFDFVVSMPLGYDVPYSWEGNIYGGASFETAISVTFPKLKDSSKVKVLPPG